MEYISIQKNLRNTPRKLRYVADMIRKMTPDRAIEALSFTNRAASADLIKAIKTALANGGNKPSLGFKKIEINEGTKIKRYRVGTAGRGRGRPYKRRLSHIKIVLSDEVLIENKEFRIKNKANKMSKKGTEQVKAGPGDLAVKTVKAEEASPNLSEEKNGSKN